MINIAVIGAGAISGFHIEGYLAFPGRCRIVSVVDIDRARAERQIERYHLDAVAADDIAAIADGPGVTLASVCTPPGTHAEIAVRLLEAGIHTLCEKPMAPSLQECDAILAAAGRGGAVLSVVAQNRFTTPMARLKQVLDSGLAGRVLHAQVDSHWWRGPSYYDLWWRGTWQNEGGGCTLNHAVHHVDALRWMLGRPTEIQASIANVAHGNSEVEDLSVAIMRFGSGALGQLTSSLVHGEDQRLVFQAERASIAVPWAVRASAPKPNGFPEPDPATERTLTEYHERLPALRYEGHTGQIDNVLAAIETGSGDVLVDGQQGRGTLEIITAIYKAAITGARVRLPLDDDDPFRTRDGLLAAAPRFGEKTASVPGFADNEITVTGGQ
ncbi:MAG TPA: Gfo/Idh/MocA family oxidoreductase [Streptosporangiaceae bacterium]|nr:Gfo/Idh/MocA family oxidoreductase [Streptosporangiaceae bacterium]